MANRDLSESSTSEKNLPWRLTLRATCFWAFAFLLVVGLPGCSGCFSDPTAEEEEEKNRKKLAKKKPKEDFDKPELKVLPHDDRPLSNFIKPGHWANASNRLKANNYDFRGELFAQTTDSNGNPIDLIGTDYQFASNRPIALPKGQERWSDVTYFVPRIGKQATGQSAMRRFACRLRSRGGGRDAIMDYLPVSRLYAHQYYMVVLASSADDFQFINSLDSTKPLSSAMEREASAPHYRIVFPKVLDRVPLPDNPLTWTSMAYIVWDDIDPSVMTLDQQQAMLDWLHWGGQLIVSGPASMDTLKLSFLSDYLPAESEGNIELGEESFKVWNDKFSLKERVLENNRLVSRKFDVDVSDGPVRGVELKLTDNSYFIPNTGDLIAERRVGRGRICLTAFQLKDPRICKNWKNFDNFWNNAILRRPNRKYHEPELDLVETTWASDTNRNDPRLITGLRYFSRDLKNDQNYYSLADRELLTSLGVIPEAPQESDEGTDLALDSSETALFKRTKSFDAIEHKGYTVDEESGVAGWNDSSGAADAARLCLQDAAGISIPDGKFILRTTAAYLLVLVPINWFFFWMIGRVEWAWFAAPVIAIVAALTVIKLAELDIGFARSRTEIGIMEVQEGYHRAHVTRFTSLYTSLSTPYQLNFDEMSALALPLARGRNQTSPNQNRFSVAKSTAYFLQEGSKVSLSGFQVSSNSTGMIHSEYMLPLASDAVFQWKFEDNQTCNLTYGGELPLEDVGIVRRVGSRYKGEIEVAWIGHLEPNDQKQVKFTKATDSWSLFDQWNQSKVFSPDKSNAEVSLRHLLNTAKDVRQLQAGDVRLIGWTDQDVKGLQIYPEAPQRTLRTLVVGHLQHSALADPKSDVNTRRIDGEEPEKKQQGLLEDVEGLDK